MSRYRIWIITGLALLAWLLIFAAAAVIWNSISASRGPASGAVSRAPAHTRVAPEDPG